MFFTKVKCGFCGKGFFRENGRYNEAKKFGWRQYCSLACQYQARVTRVKVKCGNPNCNKIVFRLKNQYEKSKSGRAFCSASCAAALNNTLRRKVKNCPICKKEFYGERANCSRDCWIKLLKAQPKIEKITKEEIIKGIQNFYKRNFRIPEKRECSFYNTARVKFGSWNKAIEIAGFTPNPEKFSNKYTARDGHVCNSFAEKIIDDWLTENDIEHKREVPYPENKLLRVDFVANNVWIEFFGLTGELEGYDDVIKRKLAIIKKYVIPFIALYPKDILPVNRLDKIISAIQNPPR